VSATPAGQTSAYVKNVTEGVTEKALRDALTKYGNLKSVEMVKAKVNNLHYPII
jgi:RNA recognition motif-containing protein